MLLTYWLFSYLDPPRDPFAANVLYESDGAYFLAPEDSVSSKAPGLIPLARHVSIDWDLFSAFIQRSWHEAAGHPVVLDEWMLRAGNWRDSEGWLHVPVRGSMSPYRRVVSVQESAVRHALSERARSGKLLYPTGTVFVADHMDGGRVVETTIMWKRESASWDFLSYDENGRLTDRIHKEPKPLQSPIQCMGCHTGNRAFEPERSFPAAVTDGPNGDRYIEVEDSARDGLVASLLGEHVRRSDTILGLYATIYLARVRARVLTGNGSASDSLLLLDQDIPFTSDPT